MVNKIYMKKSEIRKDYLSNRYVIIAPLREGRPHQFSEQVITDPKASPFTNDKIRTSDIIDSIGKGNKRAVVLANKFPAITPSNKKAYGWQEVVIETPDPTLRLADLDIEQIKNIFKLYANRTKVLIKKPRINYVLCFKNEGLRAGASLSHAHSQIFATEIVPPRIMETEERLQEYAIINDKSFYADIVKQEMKSPRRIYEDKQVAVFSPFASFYEYEAWIVVKRRISSILNLTNLELNSIAKTLSNILKTIKQIGAPYNFFFHTVKSASAENFCIKIEPRTHVWAGLELDSSLTVNGVPPEVAAKIYRKSFI